MPSPRDLSPNAIGAGRLRRLEKLDTITAIPLERPTGEFSTCSFDKGAVAHLLNPADATALEVKTSDRAYGVLLKHIARHSAKPVSSFWMGDDADSDDSDDDGEVEDEQDEDPMFAFKAGLGVFELLDLDGNKIIAVHQSCGPPLASPCGPPEKPYSLILLAPGQGRENALKALVTHLIRMADRKKPNTYCIYVYNPKGKYWRRDSREVARPLESVVLPPATKNALIDDITEFLSVEARQWYLSHGIPYKRSFLFYGVPGAGKTSLVQALAGRLQRDVCFLQPTHPDMTDDALKAAIQRAPHKSIIVLEDVDALFDLKRRKLGGAGQSPLTFSGLLNALDGVGGAGGRIFVLTTNHRENLDPALIRSGRVDLHVRFDFVVDEQLEGIFKNFYPHCEPEQPTQFAKAVRAVLDGRQVAAATVQSLFIKCRRMSAAEAIDRVGFIADELDSRDVNAKPVKRHLGADVDGDDEEE